MQITGIAINADAAKLDGDMAVLRRELAYYAKLGFSHVEIAPHGAGVMYNGHLHQGKMAELLTVLAEYSLQYTVHGPNPLNLMNREDPVTERRMFVASIQFAAAIGADVMVYHAGRFIPEEKFLLPRQEILTPLTKKTLWNMERTLLREMGDVAAKYGVTIAVENARPYLDASPYCYGEFLTSLAVMVRDVSHPAVGITLDIGHAYLAAGHYGYDLLAGVDAVAPYVRHIHLHDNFGKSCASYEKKQYEMAATGRGDMHMPVGWGSVPAGDVLARLKNYRGVVTLEIRPRYRAYYGEALANTRALLGTGEQGTGTQKTGVFPRKNAGCRRK